jgi:beta-glucosidase-like glycosyl hydrolase
MIRGGKSYLKHDDYKEYYKNNNLGVLWSCFENREDFERVCNDMGKTVEGRYVDDLLKDLTNTLNSCMRIPTMVAVDAGNGINREKLPGHASLTTTTGLGATRDPQLAYEYGKYLGEDLRLSGIRWLWSPVADSTDHYEDLRQVSSDYENNAKILTAFIKGLQSAGVAACAKHFPGSDPFDYRDSHFCSASYAQSYEYWEKTQAREFKACIEAGVDSIMVGHSTFPAVDDTLVNGKYLPCTLSKKVITDLIKGKLNFGGVVLTDDAAMKGMRTIYNNEEACIVAINAGIDMILSPQIPDYIDTIEKAVLDGRIPESRIDDACQRVLDMKERYGVFDQESYTYPTEEEREEVREKIKDLMRRIAQKGITLTANSAGLLPLNKEKIKKVKIVYFGYNDEAYEKLNCAVKEFERHGAQCDLQREFTVADVWSCEKYDLIVYASYLSFHSPLGGQHYYGNDCHAVARSFTSNVDKSIGISMGSTDSYFNYFSSAKTFINCYSFNEQILEGFVKGLYGELEFTDYNPFPLNPITKTNDIDFIRVM